jgi:hypothetical protein
VRILAVAFKFSPILLSISPGLAALLFIAAGVLMFWVIRDARGTFGLEPNDPSKLHAGPKEYNVLTCTGYAKGVTKDRSTSVSGDIQGNMSVYEGTGSGSVTGKIRSKTTVHDQFFIATADGSEMPVQVNDVDLALNNGHLVSAVWAIRSGKHRGPFILFRNHTTGRRDFVHPEVIKIMRLSTGMMTLSLLLAAVALWGSASALPVLAIAVVGFGMKMITDQRVKHLYGEGSAQLIVLLDDRARQFKEGQLSQPSVSAG